MNAILLDMHTFRSQWGQFLVRNKPSVCVCVLFDWTQSNQRNFILQDNM